MSRLILEPRGSYQSNPEQPSRPAIPRRRRKPLVLEVTPDDGYFERLRNQEPSTSPRPTDSDSKSPTMTFTRRLRKKGSLFAKLAPKDTHDKEKDVAPADGKEAPSLEDEEKKEEPALDDGHYGHDEYSKQDNSSLSLSASSSSTISQSPPTASALLPNPTATEASSSPPVGRIARLASALNLESSRLEISLLALGILILVVLMSAVLWVGVRRRRRSVQWHQIEQQQRLSEDKDQDPHQDKTQNAAAKRSRFSSKAGTVLRSSFHGSSSGGHGLDNADMMPAFLKKTHTAGHGTSSLWERFKARLSGPLVETKGNMRADTATGRKECLFDDVSPSSSSGACFVKDYFDSQDESGPSYFVAHKGKLLGGGGTGHHYHNLVLGPSTAVPASIPPAPKSPPSPAETSIPSTASEFIENVRRRSSTILTDTIMPPVHVQMEVLTEIGRRVSATLHSTVGPVISRGLRERRATDDEIGHERGGGDGVYDYSRPPYYGNISAGPGDDELSSSSNEGSVYLTPSEEIYPRDVEAGRLPSRADEASAVASGATRHLSSKGFSPAGSTLKDSLRGSEGLVRRAKIHSHNPSHHKHKRVSFVEGFVSPLPSSAGASNSGGLLGDIRRNSSFTFLQRGLAAARRPGDEEMGGLVGVDYGADDAHRPTGYGEESEKTAFHLV
ncbi:hypothetical protein V8F20_002229 [Naviculisporaceae sp. PSN 640]